MERECRIDTNNTDCYYYVKGYCHSREVGAMYCTLKGAACETKRADIKGEQWKEKYWNLMRMIREKVAR
jgi:hypothetical protein